MGVSSSKIEEDKALQLCRERKKFVRQALDGRCALAAAHVVYIKSLKDTGIALRKFVEPQAPVESSLYTSTNATPEPLALTEKSLSQFSLSSLTFSQRVDVNEAISPSPSPPSSSQFHVNHMKFRGTFSRKVEEKPSVPITATVMSSSTPQNTTPRSTERPETTLSEAPPPPPWDYFVLSHPIDHQFSRREGKEMNGVLDSADDTRQFGEEEGVPELENEENASSQVSSPRNEESHDSEDDFDEPSTEPFVRSFENLNRVHDLAAASASPTMHSAGTAASETDLMTEDKPKTPDLSPSKTTSSPVALPSKTSKTQGKEDCNENKVSPKDFFSSIKDIEDLFIRASDSGKEVPRMLEANKFNFRPIVPGKKRETMASTVFKACFSCGEDPSQVQEEPAQSDVKYLTWHRTVSSRSSSSRNLLVSNSKGDAEDPTSNLFDSICMISGSHASTLERLYAWERKLYDEVKASEMVRRRYDMMCKNLQQLESKEVSSRKIDKTRAAVKDLHSRIIVAIHRIDTISKRIEELRDRELQPQLEELIGGLNRMWEVMLECHKLQYYIISVAHNHSSVKIFVHSESHRQIAALLENELSCLSSSFTKWIGAHKSYLDSINTWLVKCVRVQQKSSRRKRRAQAPSLRDYGPPIYVTCGVWLEKLDGLPTKEVADSIKNLTAETSRFFPHQEKNQGKSASHSHLSDNHSDSAVNDFRDEASEDWIPGLDRFRSRLEEFLGRLNKFAEASVQMYRELENEIRVAKSKNETKSQA